MLFGWILILSNLFIVGISYKVYSTIDKWTGIKYDCIYAHLTPKIFQDLTRKDRNIYHQSKEQIIPYCLIVEDFVINEKSCSRNGGSIWKFEDLENKNFTSEDLMNWNAAIDIIDEYERYWQTENNESSLVQFCNCTNRTQFGRECQYKFNVMEESFETILVSHFSHLPWIHENESGWMNDMDVTCYERDPSCYGSCLDWRQICNNIVDCNDSHDEVLCDLIEYNECSNDEYRCRSGHCIPLIFAFDKTLDCVDASDEEISFVRSFGFSQCYKKVPNMFCDDFSDAWRMFPCGDGESTANPFHGCSNRRHSRILKQLYTDDNTLCWQYFICILYMDYLFPLLINCSTLCHENRQCSSFLSSVCEDTTIIFPPKSIMYSPPIYLAYQTNKSYENYFEFLPDYICYSQCDHLYPPTSRIHKYSCRSINELMDVPFSLPSTLHALITYMLFLFVGCTNHTNTSNSSLIYHCPQEGRAISSHRIKDGFQDCFFNSDELFDGNTCIQNSSQRFQCWNNSNECIHLRFVQDRKVDCLDFSDELYDFQCYYGTESVCDYQRGLNRIEIIQYDFQVLCNGIERKPSLFSLLNGTDETDCENFWCLSSASTRCNGYWDCVDGHDELNCSLDSLPSYGKSSKLLHTLNGCNATEHFCLYVSNRSEESFRSCLHVSRAGDGHVDCWGASDERHSICYYSRGTDNWGLVYRCAGEMNLCRKVNRVCTREDECSRTDDDKICPWLPTNHRYDLFAFFYCRNGTALARHKFQCNGKLDCADGEDEWFCDLKITPPSLPSLYEIQHPIYFSILQNISVKPIQYIQRNILVSSDIKSDWYCNRGMPIIDGTQHRCLCPSSYSGERCENQRQRISIFLQLVLPPSFEQDIAIKLIVYLIDILTLNILAEEEIVHLPYIHLSFKHLISISSVKANNSFVRVDAYEVTRQQVIGYRTSWKFNIPFPFLPVRRLVTQLIISKNEDSVSRIRFTCQSCVFGQCIAYENSEDGFCRCSNGWTGRNCNISIVCASGAQSLNSLRCLCPLNRDGNRCFAPNIAICQCHNGATCIPLEARTGQSACLCSNRYFGTYCEREHASVTIQSFDEQLPEILPIVLFQFVKLDDNDIGSFENIFLHAHVSTHQSLAIYHLNYDAISLMVLTKVFYSSSVDDYKYYLLFKMPFDMYSFEVRSKHIQVKLDSKQQCAHVRDMDIFKKPINIFAFPYIKRIKYYLRGCFDNKTLCFHDETYFCLCSIQKDQTGNCIIYDHAREKCHKPNYCLNQGLCIENRRKDIVNFACLCPSCHYYGPLCQFSTGQRGLSLDALLGLEIRTGKTLSEQSILIKLCMAILSGMITLGFIGNTLSIITFARKNSRTMGCGYYLLVISIYNQFALIILGLRFLYLLLTQIIVWKDRTRSLILCQCLEYGLTLLPSLSNWLSACVSIERAFTVTRGVLCDKQASIRRAKLLCIILLLLLASMTFYEPITHDLVEDPRLSRYTWCVTKFNSVQWQILASTFSILHLLGPFLINLISTGFLIVIITRQKLNLRKDIVQKSFNTILREQIAYYKDLIISPTILLILALPRLIISLGSLCIDTSWRNYVFVAGYFISFIPFMATLFIFTIPSPVYRNELKLSLLTTRRRLFPNN